MIEVYQIQLFHTHTKGGQISILVQIHEKIMSRTTGARDCKFLTILNNLIYLEPFSLSILVYPGQSWSILVYLDLSWFILVCLSSVWFILIYYLGLSWVISHHFGQKLDILGYLVLSPLSWAILGYCVLSRAISSNLRLPRAILAITCYIWLSLAIAGYLWLYMVT